MEWIKIKSEHISPEFTDAQVGSLIRFQLLVARLKRLPTDKEISRETSIKVWRTTKQVLRKFGATPEQVVSKLMEDSKQVDRKREAGKKRQAEFRNNNKENSDLVVKSNALRKETVTEHIREDKIKGDEIREDKINIKNLDLVKDTRSKAPLNINYEDFLIEWNLELRPKVMALNKTRKAKLKQRMNQDADFWTHFKACIPKIKASPFLTGDNKQGWMATFDWVIQNDTNYMKILEDNYGNETSKTRPGFSEEEMREVARKYMVVDPD